LIEVLVLSVNAQRLGQHYLLREKGRQDEHQIAELGKSIVAKQCLLVLEYKVLEYACSKNIHRKYIVQYIKSRSIYVTPPVLTPPLGVHV